MVDISTLTKRYYTIAEVSKIFGVAKSLLRYWEGEFKEIQPRKDRGGVRRYTAKDIEQIKKIYELVKERGFTIEGARKEMAGPTKGDADLGEIKARMSSVLDRLVRLRKQL